MSRAATVLKLWEDYPSKSPSIGSPATNKDLITIYNAFNKSYFKGELPKCEIKFSKTMRNTHGKTSVQYSSHLSGIKRLNMAINAVNMTDLDKLYNTVAHEMIHVWQFAMAAKTGEHKYVDRRASLLSRGHFTKGHGHYFTLWMNKLNGQGFSVSISDDVGADSTIDTVYGLVLYFRDDPDSCMLLYMQSDPTSKMDDLFKNIDDRFGQGFFARYVLFKTTSGVIITGTQLTKSFGVPKGAVNIKYAKGPVDDIVHSDKSSIIKAEDIGERDETLPASVIQMVQVFHKHRPKMGLKSYYANIVINLPEYKGKFDIKKVREMDPHDGIPDEIKEYIRKDWMDVTDAEINRTHTFKSFYYDVKDALRKGSRLAPNAVDEITDDYDQDFKDRVDFERYKTLMQNWVAKKLVKDKKAGSLGTTAKEVIAGLQNTLFKGTVLENKMSKADTFLDENPVAEAKEVPMSEKWTLMDDRELELMLKSLVDKIKENFAKLENFEKTYSIVRGMIGYMAGAEKIRDKDDQKGLKKLQKSMTWSALRK